MWIDVGRNVVVANSVALAVEVVNVVTVPESIMWMQQDVGDCGRCCSGKPVVHMRGTNVVAGVRPCQWDLLDATTCV